MKHGGIKWGRTKDELRKAMRLMQDGDTVNAALVLQQQIEHIEAALNEHQVARREKILRKRRERLLAKMDRKRIDTAADP